MIQEIVNTFHKMGLVSDFFLIGFLCGGYSIYKYQHYQINEATIIGGLVFDNKVFDIKRRP